MSNPYNWPDGAFKKEVLLNSRYPYWSEECSCDFDDYGNFIWQDDKCYVHEPYFNMVEPVYPETACDVLGYSHGMHILRTWPV